MSERTIIAVNLGQRLVLTDRHEFYPITTLLDFEGEETEDLDEVRVIVAGAGNHWFSIDYSGFTKDALPSWRPRGRHVARTNERTN